MNAKWIALLDVFEAVLQLIFHAIKICLRNFPGAKKEQIRSQQILILACKVALCSKIEGIPPHFYSMSYQIIALLLHRFPLIEVSRLLFSPVQMTSF
jgi:hypothetical protein